MSEATSTRTTQPAEGEQADLASHYDTDGMLAVERKGNPFMRSPTGGRVLSAMMLPLFILRPPSGFGVITTTGRRTGKTRRNCTRPGGWIEQILKIDTTDGATLSWSQQSCYPGEPVFVARPDAEHEDDGVLLSVVLDAEQGRADPSYSCSTPPI
jgi:hypothetical protein